MMHSFDYGNGVTILGIYFKVQSFVFMPCFGLNQGILPIIAYNYGANKKPRFVKAFKIAIITALTIMIIGTVLFLTVSDKIIGLFENVAADEVLKAEMVVAFRKICICFIPAAVSIISITMFQSVGYGVRSMIMSILRQLVILIPVALFFCAIGHKNQLWWAYPIAEITVVAVFLPIAIKTIRKVFKEKEQALSPAQE